MKKLSCLVGRHSWTTTVEHGETVTACNVCGAEPKRGGASTAAYADDLLSAKTTGESNKSSASKY